MSAGDSVQLQVKLLRPYTFDECTFDFTDPRCARPIEFFGDAEFSQEVAVFVPLKETLHNATEYQRTAEEALALSDGAVFKPALSSEFCENLSLGEAVLPAPVFVFEERFSLGESTPQASFSVFVEDIALGAAIPQTPVSNFVESIALVGSQPPALHTEVERDVPVKETRMNHISRTHMTRFAIEEQQSRGFTARRTYAEDVPLRVTHGVHIEQIHIARIGLSEMLVSPLQSVFIEQIPVYDAVMRASEASLSGIVIGKGMTFEEFKSRLVRPVGFEAFRPFRVGEYEYDRALVRILMTAGTYGAIPEIYDVSMNVDIDDTVDRGSAHLAAKETAIPYNKHYYTKPEVTVTLRSANTADGVLMPEITAIDTESFTCVLRKSDGTAAAGTISWTAVGY